MFLRPLKSVNLEGYNTDCAVIVGKLYLEGGGDMPEVAGSVHLQKQIRCILAYACFDGCKSLNRKRRC